MCHVPASSAGLLGLKLAFWVHSGEFSLVYSIVSYIAVLLCLLQHVNPNMWCKKCSVCCKDTLHLIMFLLLHRRELLELLQTSNHYLPSAAAWTLTKVLQTFFLYLLCDTFNQIPFLLQSMLWEELCVVYARLGYHQVAFLKCWHK